MSRIHIVARDNGAGLSQDIGILARALDEAGADVSISAIGDSRARNMVRNVRLRTSLLRQRWKEGAVRGRFDVNLVLQHVPAKYLELARRNALIPNPEWFPREYQRHLPAIDSVLAKTHHAEAIFRNLGCHTEFVNFTSADRRVADLPRELTFLHVAGRSGLKGTQPLVDLWQRRPHWPLLTVVQREKLRLADAPRHNLHFVTRYLHDEELRELQNRNTFHLCPSETEGFGHYLVEGLGVGAIVLATDAPPMNEIVTAERGILVPYHSAGTQDLATTYQVDQDALEVGVERMLALDAGERATLRENARAWYESNDGDFRRRLAAAVERLAAS
ncbi:MAG TPA: glycosyltransferase [Dokdonella sp.]